MGYRYWLWMGGRLLLGVALVAWAASYIGTGSSEKEFQKTLDAMKQVHSFRVAYSATGYPDSSQHNDMLWEVDCDRQAVHYQMHLVETSRSPPLDINRDEMHVAGLEYDRQADGSWSTGQRDGSNSLGFICRHLSEGTDSNVLPQIATMIKRGVLQKGDKKTVNGVRCREWLVTLRGGPSGLEHDTVCLGVEDHLPYEMSTDWNHSRASISNYNTPIQFDLPAAALQSASANSTN